MSDVYEGQWEPAAATFFDDKVAIQAILPSVRKLADWAFEHQDEFQDAVDKAYLPRIKKARGHNREMLQEGYRNSVEDLAAVTAISLAYSTFVQGPEAVAGAGNA